LGDDFSGSGEIRLRVFSKSDVAERLRGLGVQDEPLSVARLPRADGVRVILSGGDAIELRCDGTVERKGIPSGKTYFDSAGKPFAWYEGQVLRFLEAPASHEVGNQIAVDPNGRYFVTTDGPRPDKETRIYATGQVERQLGTTPLAGNHTRVFSTDDEVVVVPSRIVWK
jgi:hypothetical protein